MKLKFGHKRKFAWIKPQSARDCWLLASILGKGDIIKARTKRAIKIKRGVEGVKKSKAMTLSIELAKLEFHEQTGRLRLGGKIVEGPEEAPIGRWHSIQAKPGKKLKIWKSWKSWHLRRLKQARIREPALYALILDYSRATAMKIKDGIKQIASFFNPESGKDYKAKGNRIYFGNLAAELEKNRENYDKLLIAGPGPAKKDLFNFLKEKKQELADEILIDKVAHLGDAGARELCRRGAIDKAVKESRTAEEVKLVDKFFKKLAQEGNVTYGEAAVKKALAAGAVGKLLITESMLKKFDRYAEKAEKIGAEIEIISDKHSEGIRLKKIGGLAAFLRFKPEKL